MGSCMSSENSASYSSPPSTTVKVITSDGGLREYPPPTTVSHVLEEETASSPSWFMCSSDRLYYDEFIPVLDIDEELQANQIYFILPKSKLQTQLTAADMAAMAVKASSALKNSRVDTNNKSKNKIIRQRSHKSRICPILVSKKSVLTTSEEEKTGNIPVAANEKRIGLGVVGDIQKPLKRVGGNGNNGNNKTPVMAKSGSVRRLQRYTSRRAKTAVRSFRLRLSTIYEGVSL